MQLSTLNALSPLDGRYAKKVDNLRQYFSEFALIKFRVEVEIKWLISLSDEKAIKEVTNLSASTRELLQKTIQSFSETDAAEIKKIEETTNHDVKAVEYWLKNKFKDNQEIKSISEFRIITLLLILFLILSIISNILSEQFLIIEIFLLSSNNEPLR